VINSLEYAVDQSSALKMETVCFSETLAYTGEFKLRRNPEAHHHHPRRRENIKSDILSYDHPFFLSNMHEK
jgi:hypothetical protein